jgi:hypothetical protein
MTFYISLRVALICLGVLLGIVLLIILMIRRLLHMQTVSFTVNIVISPAAPPPLTKISDPLNLTGQVGVPFSASLSNNVQGGTPPLTFALSGALPDGLSTDGAGNISGTPTTAGTSTISVSVSDSSV